MKEIKYTLLSLLAMFMVLAGCEDEIELGTPTAAEFEVAPVAGDGNRYTLTAKDNGSAIYKWTLETGQVLEGQTVVAYLPFKGEYDVTLTAYSQGGASSSQGSIVVDETDPTICSNEPLQVLTGGCSVDEGKKWKVAASQAGHFGVGPTNSTAPIWYAAAPNEKEGGGMYDDVYTFFLNNFKFDQETNGDVFINGAQVPNFPGAVEAVGDYNAPYDAPESISYNLDDNGDGTYMLSFSNSGFIGYYTGVNTYQVLTLEENKIVLKYFDAANAELAWYITLIPEGFTPPPPPPPTTATLPLDFEGSNVPPFTGFDGSTFQVINNPDANGVNTSAKVGEFVKGTGQPYAGLEVNLAQKVDFSSKSVFRMKVYSPVATTVTLKFQEGGDFANGVDRQVSIVEANTWTDLSFDFSGSESGKFDRLVLFLDITNNNGGTLYFDDIRQESVPAELTEAALTGGGSKTWMLKPAAGSFGVGPTKGSDAYYPNGSDISGDRPCLFNDQFIFKTGGVYEYNTQGDIYGEAYMGVEEGCQDEANLTGDAAIWQSGTHSFSFTAATDTEPAYITVTGLGAFIALPKAYNGGEHAEAPTVSSSVTYEVLEYVKTAEAETLSIAVDISSDGTVFWSFVLESK